MQRLKEREEFFQLLRERGHRVTGTRTALFEEIFSHHHHLDAEELHRSLRARGVKISRATVYRNLDLLVELGLARRQRLGRRGYLYEHVHRGQHHDHLVCESCGRVVEFVSPGITALQREICRAHGFVPQHHHLQITGRCQECGAAEQPHEDSSREAQRVAGG